MSRVDWVAAVEPGSAVESKLEAVAAAEAVRVVVQLGRAEFASEGLGLVLVLVRLLPLQRV